MEDGRWEGYEQGGGMVSERVRGCEQGWQLMIKVWWGESMWRTERKNLHVQSHEHFLHTPFGNQ